jgi:5'-3' exoribonuclease 1
MISDIVSIPDIRVAFEPGRPFLPFQQLLSVLPAASCKLLPAPYQVRRVSFVKASLGG